MVSVFFSVTSIIENFSLFDTWEEKYSYIIELGERLPRLDESIKSNSKYLIPGCISKVWLIHKKQNNLLFFDIDSDALIVRGLLYILKDFLSGKSCQYIVSFDPEIEFVNIGLKSHLSPSRANGFFSVINKMKKIASQSL